MQIQTLSDIQSYKGTDTFGYDVSCNLGSLNIVNVMENKEIAEAVSTAVRALTTVTLDTSIDEVPSVKKGNDAFNSIGLGVMNLHGFLAKNSIHYESREAKDFANTFFATMRFYALKESMEIAKERHETFAHFEKSEYAKGTALKMYLKNSFEPRTEKVKALFKDIHVPTMEEWQWLDKQIKTHGLFHAYLMACAPTGSISYIQNSTPSVMPITEKIETRLYGDSLTQYPMPYMDNKSFWYYKEAYNMDMFKLIDLMAVIQQHVDQSISTTLFVDSSRITDADMARYYIYAHKKGLKSLYYARTKVSTVDECISCAV